MADWSYLLDHLAAGPREDGTPELAATATWLVEELQRRGLTAERFDWLAHPWRLRTIGVVALLGAATYVFAMLRNKRALAIAITLLVPAYVILEVDFGVPVLGPLHSSPQQHLVATLAPTGPPRARLIFSAHYDTKTDLLDHVERTPITLAGLPLTVLMLVAALRPRPRLTKVAVIGAALNGLGLFAVQTGGAFVPSRSPGAIDDGAGCAVLLELASTLKPLEHTEVKLVFFSGEEIGIEGARAYVKAIAQRPQGVERHSGPRETGGVNDRALPTKVINLDGVGLSPTLALFKSEGGVVRSFDPDPGLVAAVDRVSPLYRPFYPGTTDARAFLEQGIPAMNLASDLPGHALPRGMHSMADSRDRVDLAALDQTVKVLIEVAQHLDTGG